MPAPEQIRRAVEGYVTSFNQQNRREFLALFTDDVIQIDPVGSAPRAGVARLAEFWDGLYEVASKVEFQIVDLIISGDEAALLFRIVQHATSGDTEVRGIDVFTVNDDGLITLVKGYSDADHIKANGAAA
jgi:steroid delta-isomerase